MPDLRLSPGLNVRLDQKIPGPQFGIMLFVPEAEMARFLEDYARYEKKVQTTGKKTWAALLVARYKKVVEKKDKPLDPASDSHVKHAMVIAEEEPVQIVREGDKFVAKYGERFDRTAKRVVAGISDEKQRQRVEGLIKFIHSGNELKRRVFNAAIEHQQRFLRSGDIMDIQPIIQRELANKVGLHLSTVNRIIGKVNFYYGRRRIKAVHLIPGTYFNQVVLTEAIRRLRKKSKEPLSDPELLRLLSERFPKKFNTHGTVTLARRTVTKFSGKNKLDRRNSAYKRRSKP